MTYKQSRATQRALEKALFERPAASRAQPKSLEDQLESIERTLRSPLLGRSLRMRLERARSKLAGQIEARAAVRAALDKSEPDETSP